MNNNGRLTITLLLLSGLMGPTPLAVAAPGQGHDMDMGSVEGLQANFAHKELAVLNEVAVPPAFSEGLGAAYGRYLEAAAALVTADIPQLDEAATKMREVVDGLQAEQLDGAAREAWLGHQEVLRTGLHQLVTASDLATKREHFSHVSEAMYCALRSFGGIKQSVNVAYCPMAFDRKGAYWLSDERAIANPYLGPDMATCGELKETLR